MNQYQLYIGLIMLLVNESNPVDNVCVFVKKTAIIAEQSTAKTKLVKLPLDVSGCLPYEIHVLFSLQVWVKRK